ncbi:MAG TPA: RIP metalloprotease RseP [Candidatus Cloacimonetes bacterium]|nr:RIP metalloprotease RseP [Candidatus Cloacimonadota bacterium]HEX37353.1 RIP metalloprotease RseP [Candidatus Cloacimonadota bacterium]
MITIIAIIFLIGILVFVHEFGHFIVARLNHVKVEKFSFGFGPKLISWNIRETEYRISLIPLGGYVKMLGENPEEESEEELQSEESFKQKRWWQKSLIAFGGPFANFLFAMMILSLTYIIGIKTYDLKPEVGRIDHSVLSEVSPLQENDYILEINNAEVPTWTAIIKEWVNIEQDEVEIKLCRGNDTLIVITPNFNYRYWFSNIQPKVAAVVGDVYYGLPAYQAGIKTGDRILQIGDKQIDDWYDMQNVIKNNVDNPLTFIILRDGKTIEMQITPQTNIELEDEEGIIGISQVLENEYIERFSIPTSFKYGFLTTINIIGRYYSGLAKLVKYPSEIGKSVGGPIMIASLTSQQVKEGVSAYLSFLAMVSVILMIVNLLPIPVLDGGMIIFSIIEGIKGKPLTLTTQAVLQRIGIVILLLIMFFAFYNDISRSLGRYFSLKTPNTTENTEKQQK